MIKQATLEHINELLRLENKLFGSNDFAMSRGSFYYHMKRNQLYVYKEKNEIVGYILWLKRKTYYRLYSLGVCESFRNKGISKALLAYSFVHLKSDAYTLEVKKINQSAIALYEQFGFIKQKILSEYYPDNTDAYFMKKYNNDEFKTL